MMKIVQCTVRSIKTLQPKGATITYRVMTPRIIWSQPYMWRKENYRKTCPAHRKISNWCVTLNSSSLIWRELKLMVPSRRWKHSLNCLPKTNYWSFKGEVWLILWLCRFQSKDHTLLLTTKWTIRWKTNLKMQISKLKKQASFNSLVYKLMLSSGTLSPQ